MYESEQFDDLTSTDVDMPPIQKTTASLEDVNNGELPTPDDYEAIHEGEEMILPDGSACFTATIGKKDDPKMDESAYSFYGVESYLLPKSN